MPHNCRNWEAENDSGWSQSGQANERRSAGAVATVLSRIAAPHIGHAGALPGFSRNNSASVGKVTATLVVPYRFPIPNGGLVNLFGAFLNPRDDEASARACFQTRSCGNSGHRHAADRNAWQYTIARVRSWRSSVLSG